MRSMIRQFRRAPLRILASTFALALAVGAVGVLATPAVTGDALTEVTARDGLADIIVATTPISADQLAAIRAVDGVAAAEGQVAVRMVGPGGASIRVVGLPFGPDQRMDRVTLMAGRAPRGGTEIVADPRFATVGEVVELDGRAHRVVGIGSTFWWSDAATVYATLDTVLPLSPEHQVDRLVITAVDDDADELRSITTAAREVLAAGGDTFVELPVHLADGTTPITDDIAQVSSLVGLLGAAAGVIALVLLASTTSTLVAERTREVAVMRALGARQRPLRRRLRRIAMAITAASLVVGLPLGVVVANLIARLVLEEFVGITPGFGWSWRVVVLSAVGAVLGARIVAAGAARRVTRLPLAAALRDREGAPFGRRWSDRMVARLRLGGLATRMGIRASLHRRTRAMAVVAQFGAGVGAAVVIVGLTVSVNDYNAATRAPWSWETRILATDPGLAIPVDAADDIAGAETGIVGYGEVEEWEIEMIGLSAATGVFDPMVRTGTWIEAGSRNAVVSAGFAAHNGIAVGDAIAVELGSGTARYDVVGLGDDASRAVYVDRDVLADDLGTPGMANVVWSSSGRLPEVAADVESTTAAELDEEEAAARQAIVVIFGAIGLVVSVVAVLAVVSTMSVNLFERRHELAAMQALGARRRDLRRVVLRELVPLAIAGVGLGVLVGWLGTLGIIASFEASNAVEIGATFVPAVVPLAAFGVLVGLVALAAILVRGATRRPIAVILRGAA